MFSHGQQRTTTSKQISKGTLRCFPFSLLVKIGKTKVEPGTEAPTYNLIWKAEMERIAVQGQPRQVVCETPISKITTAK
jgi:hypothetical protein